MKNSIKRAQSQACLGFAERKNFRPLAKLKKLSLTLLLLITAATSAWAQTQWTSGVCTVTLSNGTLTVSGKGAMADYTSSDRRPWHNNRNDITSVVVESGVTSLGKNTFESFSNLTSVTLPEDLTAIGPYAISNCSSLQSITIPSTVTSIGEGAFMSNSAMTSVTLPEGLMAIGAGAFGSCSSLTSITIPSTVTSIGNYAFMSSSAISDVNLYANPDNLTWGITNYDFKKSKATKCHVLAEHLSAYQNNFSSVNVTFVGDLEPLPTPIEVTTNAASKQDIFTTASFTMPASDVTVNYTLVRDMQDATNPVAFSGLPSSGNIIVKKGDDGKYQPAETLTIQLIDPVAAAEAQNIIAADGITIKVLVGAVNGQGAIDYDQDNPITLDAFLADMTPGYYWIKAEPTDENSPYDGTVYSSEFTVVEKYNLTVKPANDFSKGKIESVTVGTETIAPNATGEAAKTGVAPDTEVKLKAKRGYIIEKVETGKTVFIKLNAATAENIGMVVCNKGHLHDAKTAVPAGCTAVGILGKVTATGHGLILALKDATSQTWNTINGWTSASYAGTTLKVLPDDAARGTNLTSYTTLGETTVSNWAVAQKNDYDAIFTNLGSTTGDQNGKAYDDNVNAYITGAGGTAIDGGYWSTTEYNAQIAWNFYYYFYVYNKTYSMSVRPVIGF